jgi:hypothetical protein
MYIVHGTNKNIILALHYIFFQEKIAWSPVPAEIRLNIKVSDFYWGWVGLV